MKIYVGYFVTFKARDMGKNTREGRTINISKEMVGCFKTVVGNKKFLIQLKDVQL